MYAAAGRLDPDSMHAVALLAYREMAAAGYVAVGEFHYVHHRPDGTPYSPPNAMALATARAADEAGIDQVLLMAAYERAGADSPPTPGQRRFCDPGVGAYLARVDALAQERPRPGGSRPAQRPRRLSPVARGDRPLRRRGRHGGAHPRLRAAARDRGVPGRARAAADRAPGRRGRAGAAHDDRACHPCLRRRARPARRGGGVGVRVPDHRGQSRRRLPAGGGDVRARHPRLHRHRLQHRDRPGGGAARDRGGRPALGAAPKRARARGRRRPHRLPARGGQPPRRRGARARGARPPTSSSTCPRRTWPGSIRPMPRRH